jgi:hypothetical protein
VIECQTANRDAGREIVRWRRGVPPGPFPGRAAPQPMNILAVSRSGAELDTVRAVLRQPLHWQRLLRTSGLAGDSRQELAWFQKNRETRERLATESHGITRTKTRTGKYALAKR